MAFCRYCGNKLNDGDTVCANCGNEVKPPVGQTPQQNTPYLQQTQEPRSIGSSKPSGNKKTAIIIIAILVAIAIIASVVLYLFVVKDKKADNDSAEANSKSSSNEEADDSTTADLSDCAGLEKLALDILGRDIDVATSVLKTYFKTDFTLSTTFADEGKFSFDPQDDADVNVLNEPWGLISCDYNDNTTHIGKFSFTKSYASSETAKNAYQELYDTFRNEYGEPSDVQEYEDSQWVCWRNALVGKDVSLSCSDYGNDGWYVFLRIG